MRRQFGKTICDIARQDKRVVLLYGDEEWSDIPDFSKYSISNTGRFRNKRTGKFIASRLHRSGYPIVGLWNFDCSKKITLYVHSMVARVFIGPCPLDKEEVNHKDGIKINCCVTNLEYVTKSENIRHSIAIGKRTYPTGSAHAMFGRKGENNPRYGMLHTPESREKMSIAKRGEKNPMFGTVSPNRRNRA